MKCQHKTFNKKCRICQDIVSQCGYAMKHGQVEFSGDYKDPEEWKRMRAFYMKPEPEPDEGDMSTAHELVPNTNAQYENSQCASATGEPSYEFGVR